MRMLPKKANFLVLLMLPSGRYRQCQYTHTQSTNVLSVFRSGAKWFYLRKKFSTLLLSFFSNCFFFLKIKTFFFEGGGDCRRRRSRPHPKVVTHTLKNAKMPFSSCVCESVCFGRVPMDSIRPKLLIFFVLFYDGLKINKIANVSVFFCSYNEMRRRLFS